MVVRFFAVAGKMMEKCMEEEYTQGLVEQFMQRCRGYGLKVTPQRLAIYRKLLASSEHPSADAVYKKIVQKYPTMSFDTVNRTLLTFADIGVIDTVESHSGAKRYDTDIAPHHHLHCIRCGAIIDFCDSDLDAIAIPERIIRNFTVLGKRVIIRGICPQCTDGSAVHDDHENS